MSQRTAIVRSEKNNERDTDVASKIAVLSGKRHTDGIEFEAMERINPQWNLLSNGARMRANVDKASASQAGTRGKARSTLSTILTAALNKSSRVAHPDFGRFAALQVLAMVPPCLRPAWMMPCDPSRYRARAVAGLVERSLTGSGRRASSRPAGRSAAGLRGCGFPTHSIRTSCPDTAVSIPCSSVRRRLMSSG